MLSLERESEFHRGRLYRWATPARESRGQESNLHLSPRSSASASASASRRLSRRTPALPQGVLGRLPEQVAEDRGADLLVDDVAVVRLLPGELDRGLQRQYPVEELVDPPGGQRAGELHRGPVADGDVLVVHLDLGGVLLGRLGLDVVARHLAGTDGTNRLGTPAVRGVVADPGLGRVEHGQLLDEGV